MAWTLKGFKAERVPLYRIHKNLYETKFYQNFSAIWNPADGKQVITLVDSTILLWDIEDNGAATVKTQKNLQCI